MPTVKLTKRFLDKAKVEGGDLVFWDSDLPGFGVRVKPSGVKSFCLQYRNAQGMSKRITLGRFGRMTLAEGRKEARGLLASTDRGEDPAEARSQARSAPTVADLASRYLVEHSEPKKKLVSVRKDRFLVDRYILPALGRYKIESVTRAQVAKLHHSLRDIPYQGNRVLEVVRKMFNLAEAWGLREDGTNPCRHVQKFKEHKRERYLSEKELASLGKVLTAVEADGSEMPSVATAIRLLLFTGCRLSEILGLRWGYVDFERGCLALPDSKTGAKLVPLGRAALDVLANTPRQAGNPYVCPGSKPMYHLVGFHRPWERIKGRAGLKNIRPHDLRHSFASIAVGAGLSLPVIGKLLGHTQAQTTQRYSHLAVNPLREAADEITSRINSAMRATVKEKVVPINANRKVK